MNYIFNELLWATHQIRDSLIRVCLANESESVWNPNPEPLTQDMLDQLDQDITRYEIALENAGPLLFLVLGLADATKQHSHTCLEELLKYAKKAQKHGEKCLKSGKVVPVRLSETLEYQQGAAKELRHLNTLPILEPTAMDIMTAYSKLPKSVPEVDRISAIQR